MERHKKKILFVTEALAGGILTYMADLANGLSIDFDIYIAYSTRPQTPKNFKEFFLPTVKMIQIKSFCRSINPAYDVKATIEVRKIVKNIQPDIIHLHSSKAGALGRLFLSGKKYRLFYTPHGYSFLMQDCKKFKRQFYWLLEKLCSMRKCTTISCGNGENEESLKLTKNAICIENGINIKELKTLISQAEIKKHAFTVCTVGRISYQKNPDLFNAIAKECPEIQFLWIGNGELKNNLTATNIEITGWVDRKEVIEHVMNSDVFILTSLWEGLPISLLEAMYMKKLCIVSDVIGNKDVINCHNGFICKNKEQFIDAIRKAQLNDFTDLIENAFTDICQKFNTNAMLGKYKALYGDTTGGVRK